VYLLVITSSTVYKCQTIYLRLEGNKFTNAGALRLTEVASKISNMELLG